MRNSNNSSKNSHSKKRGKENNQSQSTSLGKRNNINEEQKGKNINDNTINNDEKKLLLVIETLIRIFRFEKKIRDLCNNDDNKNNDPRCVIVSKFLIEKYKEIFQFKSLKNNFDNNPKILEYINKLLSIEDNIKEDQKEITKKKNTYILEIIAELNKNNKKLIDGIKGNNNSLSNLSDEFKLKSVKLNNNKIVFVDFEIINYDIFLLLVEQDISTNIFLFADYFINFEKILVLIKEFGNFSNNVICEIGKFIIKEQCINIEYILDTNMIKDSTLFKDKLKNIKISEIYQNINGDKKVQNGIEFKEYNFHFDNDNQEKTNNTDKIKEEEDFLKDDEKKNILDDIIIFKMDDKKK
jgi:hypothetical protein